jgi:hypothetical protein
LDSVIIFKLKNIYMKNTNLMIALLITCSLTIGCKKEKSTSEESTSTTSTTPTTQPHVNTFTAVVNGQNWSVANSLYYTGKDSNGFLFGGQSASSSPYSVIRFNFAPALGTFTLNTCCPYLGTYAQSGSMSLYSSQTGTINIAAFDTTSAGVIKTFKATFGFETVALGTQSYVVTGGNIDYIKP